MQQPIEGANPLRDLRRLANETLTDKALGLCSDLADAIYAELRMKSGSEGERIDLMRQMIVGAVEYERNAAMTVLCTEPLEEPEGGFAAVAAGELIGVHCSITHADLRRTRGTTVAYWTRQCDKFSKPKQRRQLLSSVWTSDRVEYSAAAAYRNEAKLLGSLLTAIRLYARREAEAICAELRDKRSKEFEPPSKEQIQLPRSIPMRPGPNTRNKPIPLANPESLHIATGEEIAWACDLSQSSTYRHAVLELLPTGIGPSPVGYKFVAGLELHLDPTHTCKGATIEWSVPGYGQGGLLGPEYLHAHLVVHPMVDGRIPAITIEAHVKEDCDSRITFVVRGPRLVRIG